MKASATVALMVLILSGCVSQVSLIAQDGGGKYLFAVDQVARRLSGTIDGVAYTGTAVGNSSTGFANTQTFGLRPTSGFTTMTVSSNSGQVLLTGSNGDYIECVYNKDGATVIGKCQSNKGRQFVMTTD